MMHVYSVSVMNGGVWICERAVCVCIFPVIVFGRSTHTRRCLCRWSLYVKITMNASLWHIIVQKCARAVEWRISSSTNCALSQRKLWRPTRPKPPAPTPATTYTHIHTMSNTHRVYCVCALQYNAMLFEWFIVLSKPLFGDYYLVGDFRKSRENHQEFETDWDDPTLEIEIISSDFFSDIPMLPEIQDTENLAQCPIHENPAHPMLAFMTISAAMRNAAPEVRRTELNVQSGVSGYGRNFALGCALCARSLARPISSLVSVYHFSTHVSHFARQRRRRRRRRLNGGWIWMLLEGRLHSSE